MTDPPAESASPRDRIRALIARFERKERTLPALLGELKHEVAGLAEGDPLRARVIAALRALGRAWSDSDDGIHSTLTLDGEHRLREAIEDLKKAIDAD